MDFSKIEWGSVADWVSGLGSLSAVIVALYLSNAAQRVKLRGYVGLRALMGGGQPRTDLVAISITNIGNRPTRISVISIAVGVFKKREAIIPISQDSLSSPMPCPLCDGEEAHWYKPLGEGNAWLKELCKDFIFTKMDVRTLRFRIHTSNDRYLELRPEGPMRKALLSVLEEKHG